MFFDPNVDPIVTNKTPGPGKDILTASANNLYSGVSMADLKGFTEKYGLNSRLVKQNGRLVEEVYRIDGRYSTEITEIVAHLEAAIPFAHRADGQRAARADPVVPHRRGRRPRQVRHRLGARTRTRRSTPSTASSRSTSTPRGIKGSWEGLVFYVNQEKTERIRKLADNAQWFEDHMPCDAEVPQAERQGHRRQRHRRRGRDRRLRPGDAGRHQPAERPADPRAVRQQVGVAVERQRGVRQGARRASMRGEFSWTPEEAERAAKFGALAGELHTDMHEVIGHASGRQAAGAQGHAAGRDQGALLGARGRARRSGRALLHRRSEAGRARHRAGRRPGRDRPHRVRGATRATRSCSCAASREGTQIEEDHMRNRQMIVRWLMANTKAIEERQRDGKTYYVMVDPKAFRDGVGRLLAEVQRIKSEGDYAAAREAVRHLRHPLRPEAARRGRRARRRAEAAVLHRLRACRS